LKPLENTKVDVDIDPNDDIDKTMSVFSKLKKHLSSLYRNFRSAMIKGAKGESESSSDSVPIVFCYSLFYVYYDQYTYITGVLAQDVMMGIIAVFVAI